MAVRLVIEIEQDHADFDQLGHLATWFEGDVLEGAKKGSGVRIVSMTMTDEFGGLVTRYEPERTIFMDPDGTAKVQRPSDFAR
jgi:hypothetical protein